MHQTGESFGSRRADHQVPVVGHDAVGENGDRMAGEPFSQDRKKLAIITGLGEKGRLARGAVDDVAVAIGDR